MSIVMSFKKLESWYLSSDKYTMLHKKKKQTPGKIYRAK